MSRFGEASYDFAKPFRRPPACRGTTAGKDPDEGRIERANRRSCVLRRITEDEPRNRSLRWSSACYQPQVSRASVQCFEPLRSNRLGEQWAAVIGGGTSTSPHSRQSEQQRRGK